MAERASLALSRDHGGNVTIDQLDNHLSEDGTYTLALMSDTIYGRELLCDPLTFSVERGTAAGTMQASLGHEDRFHH